MANEGVTEELWQDMTDYADANGWKKGDYKKLNLPFENHIMSQPAAIRERTTKRVEDFVYNMLANVLNASDTATLGIEAILNSGSYDVGAKGQRIEDPMDWTEEKIHIKASAIDSDKGPEGDFDD